jgi:hypothetical protein
VVHADDPQVFLKAQYAKAEACEIFYFSGIKLKSLILAQIERWRHA